MSVTVTQVDIDIRADRREMTVVVGWGYGAMAKVSDVPDDLASALRSWLGPEPPTSSAPASRQGAVASLTEGKPDAM